MNLSSLHFVSVNAQSIQAVVTMYPRLEALPNECLFLTVSGG